MAENVLADAQFTTAFSLQPFKNFEDIYQGVSAGTPIMLTEGGEALDSLAGRPGYAPNLARGLPVPLGARTVLWIPKISWVDPGATSGFNGYIYSFTWRLRNVFDYRNKEDRPHYHLGRQTPGINDTTVVPPSPRVVVPASENSVVYVQPEPGTNIVRAVQNQYSEDINAKPSASLPLPLSPVGGAATLAIEQGISDPAALPQTPSYQVHELQALGDELLIGLYRVTNTGEANYQFGLGGADRQLAVLFGDVLTEDRLDRGIYVFAGSAP